MNCTSNNTCLVHVLYVHVEDLLAQAAIIYHHINISDFMYARGPRVSSGRILHTTTQGLRYLEYNINDIKRYIVYMLNIL